MLGGEYRMNDKQFNQLIQELRLMKNLLILNTLTSGASQSHVAKLLGISDRHIRRILAGKA